MQLETGERSILAYFPTAQQAKAAKEILKQQGYTETRIDRVSEYPNSELYNNSAATLATLVLGTEAYDGYPSPLLAADPSVSGMAGSSELPGNKSFLLTLVTSQDKIDQAVKIVKEHGASV
ncbi:MAG: hypothetical protein PHC92_00915 [Syntrophomonadaceae bacterium]|nr:hypothetical protein [Syntrophomonadaceae bacterium]MDD3022903.1 hypothetical protein [Syntrophomonadaceae bacterium]